MLNNPDLNIDKIISAVIKQPYFLPFTQNIEKEMSGIKQQDRLEELSYLCG